MNKSCKKRPERKTPGYLGLESHFHADASCQTCQINNSKRTNGNLSIECLSATYVSTNGGEESYVLTYLAGVNVCVGEHAFICHHHEGSLNITTKQVSPLLVWQKAS